LQQKEGKDSSRPVCNCDGFLPALKPFGVLETHGALRLELYLNGSGQHARHGTTDMRIDVHVHIFHQNCPKPNGFSREPEFELLHVAQGKAGQCGIRVGNPERDEVNQAVVFGFWKMRKQPYFIMTTC
jgi:hypothetical protein